MTHAESQAPEAPAASPWISPEGAAAASARTPLKEAIRAAEDHATRARQELQHATAAIERARMTAAAGVMPRPRSLIEWAELNVICGFLTSLGEMATEMERRIREAGRRAAQPEGEDR